MQLGGAGVERAEKRGGELGLQGAVPVAFCMALREPLLPREPQHPRLCHEKLGQDATCRLFPPTIPRERHLHTLLSIHSSDKRLSSAYYAQLETGNTAVCKTSPNPHPHGTYAAVNRKARLAEVGSACVSNTVATVSLNLNQLR